VTPAAPPAPDAGLPRALGAGLTLRWATPADTEALADHHARFLAADPAVPHEGTRGWIRTLMSGAHPTTQAGDFTLVVDERAGGRVVSSLCLISQTWTYAGIPFGVGQPEVVSTDPAYRRRGLVAAQFAAIHARSAARGHLLQAVDGIAWFYRQFGYQMTLARGGGRRWLAFRIPAPPADAPPAYRLRPAAPADIPALAGLYANHCAHGLVSRQRDAAQWRYEFGHKRFWLVEDAAGAAAGYAEARVEEGGHEPELVRSLVVDELAAAPGQSLRAVALFLGAQFQAQIDAANATRPQPLTGIALNLGPGHPVYAALGDLLEQYRPAWTWYIRVADLPAFLRLIAPALERRLAGSPLAGHSGALRLNLYRDHLRLVFAGGRLSEAAPDTATGVEDGDAHFPDGAFLHLLLGHRTLPEVNYLYPDAYATPEAAALLAVLFPPQPSNPVLLS
jgi:hypothetical protein